MYLYYRTGEWLAGILEARLKLIESTQRTTGQFKEVSQDREMAIEKSRGKL